MKRIRIDGKTLEKVKKGGEKMRMEEEPKEVEELKFMIRHALKHLVEGQYNSSIAAFEVARDCIDRLEERAKEEISWESREEEKEGEIYP